MNKFRKAIPISLHAPGFGAMSFLADGYSLISDGSKIIFSTKDRDIELNYTHENIMTKLPDNWDHNTNTFVEEPEVIAIRGEAISTIQDDYCLRGLSVIEEGFSPDYIKRDDTYEISYGLKTFSPDYALEIETYSAPYSVAQFSSKVVLMSVFDINLVDFSKGTYSGCIIRARDFKTLKSYQDNKYNTKELIFFNITECLDKYVIEEMV